MSRSKSPQAQAKSLTSSSIHKGADIIVALIQAEKAKAVAEACSELHQLKDHLAQLHEKSARQSQEAEQATRALQDAHSQALSHWREHCLVVEKERDKMKQALQVAMAGFQRKITSLRAKIDVLENNRGQSSGQQDIRETTSNPNEVPIPSNTIAKSVSASSERESTPPSKQNPLQNTHPASDTTPSSQYVSITAGVPDGKASETGGNAAWLPANNTIHQRNLPAENSGLAFPPLVPSAVSGGAPPSTASGTAAPSTMNTPELLRKFHASVQNVSDSQSMAQGPFIELSTAIPTSKMPIGTLNIESEKGPLKRLHALPESAPSNTKRSKPNHVVDDSSQKSALSPVSVAPGDLALPPSKI